MKKASFLLLLSILLPLVGAQSSYYYMHDSANPEHSEYKLMDVSQPTQSVEAYFNLDEGSITWATTPFTKDAKIEGDVRITIFIQAFFIKPDMLPFQLRIIKATLVDISPTGNIDVIESTRPTPIIFFSNETVKSHTFVMDNINYVISAEHCLGIKIEKVVDLFSYFPFSILSPFFATNVLYDSTTYRSLAVIPFNITGGIEIQCFDKEKKVKPGKEAIYNLVIYNTGSQNDVVELSSSYAGDKWEVKIEPSRLQVNANSFNYSDVIIKAPSDAKENEYLNITINAIGGGGADSIWLNTSIMPYEYGVDVIAKDKELKGEPGDKLTFSFLIKNTGDLTDTYELAVTCVWEYTLEKNAITLDAGQSEEVKVYVDIPLNATNGTKKLVALTAKSVNSGKEDSDSSSIWVYFTTSPSKESNIGKTIGLILFVVGVAALLILAWFLGRTARKAVVIGCEERVVEVAPGSSVVFPVRIVNPLEKTPKNRMKYKVSVEGKLPENWDAKLGEEELELDGGEEKEIKLKIKVPDDSPLEEWASLDVVVTPEKGKSERLNVIVTLREPKPILKTEISHEPEEFREGDRVITKIKISNVGEKDAEDKKVMVLVNGREVNRVEGVDVPRNSTVEVEIPWIAEEENHVEVRVE